MPRLKSREEASLSQQTLDALEPTRVNGKLADVFFQFANSEPSTVAYRAMENSLSSASLSELEIEAIKLAVSEINQCDFCLAIHSMKARKAGIDKAMQLAIRGDGKTDNDRVNALLDIVRTFFKQPGPLPDELLDAARSAGLSDGELVETAMAVSTIFFTNITNHINDTKPTLPPAPALPG